MITSRNRYTQRYMLAISLIGLMAFMGFLGLQQVIGAQKNDSKVINVAGRQRMLSQRLAWQATLLYQHKLGIDRAKIRSSMADALRLMRHSHQALVYGDDLLGLPGIETDRQRSLYFQPPYELDSAVQQYLLYAEAIVQADSNGEAPATAAIEYLLEKGYDELLTGLDTAVKLYEDESRAKVLRLANFETIFLIITLSLLAIEVVLIFRPMVAIIVKNEKDLTQQSTRLQQTSNELKELYQAAAHDLKTPLRGISSIASWMEEDLNTLSEAELMQHTHDIIARSKKMQLMLDGLVLISKINPTKNQERVDLYALIDELIDVIDVPQHLEVMVQPGMPELFVNRALLAQVFYQLLHNAVTFHDKSKGQVLVGYTRQIDQYTFYVKDDGPGIATKYHSKIFRMFETLGQPSTEVRTGIGLALFKKMVGAVGGKVWVESTVNEGATFYFTWPLSTIEID